MVQVLTACAAEGACSLDFLELSTMCLMMYRSAIVCCKLIERGSRMKVIKRH